MSTSRLSLLPFCRRSFYGVRGSLFPVSAIQSPWTRIAWPQRCLSACGAPQGNLLTNQKPLSAFNFRQFSTAQSDEDEKDKELKSKKTSLVQRFKESYAIYGKLVIVIHGVTSCLWFGGAYLAASSGINLLDFFEAAHFPEWACKPLRMGGGAVNTWATALILYKLIAPLRYGATLLLTRYTVHYLRSKGKVPQLAERDRLRNLARESAQLSREKVKSRVLKGRTKMISMSKRAMRGPKKG